MCLNIKFTLTPISVCVCAYSGLTSLSTYFQSYHDGVWLRQGAQCSLLQCCLTEVSCPRHLTWYHTQSHYPDTGSTTLVWLPGEEQLVPFFTTLVCHGSGSNPWPPVPRSGHSTNWAIGAGTPISEQMIKYYIHNQQFVSWIYLYAKTAAAENTLIWMGNTFLTCVFFKSKTNRTSVQTDCTILVFSK